MVKKELITDREYKFLMELSKKEGLDVRDITNNTDISKHHVYIVGCDLQKKGFVLKQKIDRERYFLVKQKDFIKVRDKEIKRINDLFKPLIEANPEKFKCEIIGKNQNKSNIEIKNNMDYCKVLIKEVQKYSPPMARRLRKKLTKLKLEVRNSSQKNKK